MPVPTSINDLSQTAASNYPAGSDSPATLDDVQRAHGSFIAQLRDGVGFSGTGAVVKSGSTGSAILPTGSTAQRDGSPVVGYLRYNTDLGKFEGYSTLGWASVGGGATGGGTDAAFYENDTEATQNGEIGASQMKSGVTITIASPAVFTLSNHGFANGQQVRLKTTGALPTGLSQTNYFVINAATNTFQLSATRGGAAINTSGTQSGTHSVGKCQNANTTGPYTILDGVTITLPDGCGWTING